MNVDMAQTTNLLIVLLLPVVGLFACDAKNSETLNGDDPIIGTTSSGNTNPLNPNMSDSTSNSDPATAEIDGRWFSNCVILSPQESAFSTQEYLVIEGSSYERTINYYQDSNCSVPDDISFLRVRSTSLQYPGGFVQTELGLASQIVVHLRVL